MFHMIMSHNMFLIITAMIGLSYVIISIVLAQLLWHGSLERTNYKTHCREDQIHTGKLGKSKW